MTDEGLFKLYNEIETVNWSILSNVSLSFEYFVNILTNNVDVSLPMKSLDKCHSKINWFDHELAQMRERL